MTQRTMQIGHNTYGRPVMQIVDFDHQRYNERYPSGSTLIATATTYDGSNPASPHPWFNFRLEEISPADKRGNRSKRTISLTLTGPERDALIKLLQMECQEGGDLRII